MMEWLNKLFGGSSSSTVAKDRLRLVLACLATLAIVVPLAYLWQDSRLPSSSCAARRNNVASSPKRPANIMPSGSPALFQASGTDIAGWPDMLNMAVPGM